MAGGGIGKCSKIRHIVRLRQMLRRWRKRAATAAAAATSSRSTAPNDVPVGHVAVCVGTSRRRFVLRMAHLNHPVFRRLLAQAEEEYGFGQSGPLSLPCEESLFEDILRHISTSSSSSPPKFANLEDFQKCSSSSGSSSSCCCCCHAGLRSSCHAESLPLLRGFAEKPVW